MSSFWKSDIAIVLYIVIGVGLFSIFVLPIILKIGNMWWEYLGVY